MVRWTGAGFVVVAAVGLGELGAGRAALYLFIGVVLVAAAGRTAYELVRRLRATR